MSILEQRRTQIFPVLTAAQRATALRFASAQAQTFAPGSIVFGLGEKNAPAFLVLEGNLDVVRRDGVGRETPITTHGPGEFSGEVSQLAGRPTLAEGRAGPGGCVAAPFDAAHVRALIVGSAELGEIVMRAFILRRTALITEGGAGSVLIGSPGTRSMVAIQGFLARNGYPSTIMDPRSEDEAAAVVERLGIGPADLPLVLCPNGTVLKNPGLAEVGACLGITPDLDPDKVYDMAVVGAGPAGLASAVYAASEGLSTIVLDSRAFGGQAGASARIENYFGFPTGISGIALTARGFNQAQKFGAEIAMPLQVERLACAGDQQRADAPHGLILTDGRSIRARTVVIASGVGYRRPDIANLAHFEGNGVSYWASPVEAKLCEGEEIALVGAGNSAGQAVVFLAPKVAHLHMVVRGEGLEASMSSYLIERIAALPNVTIHTHHEVAALEGTEDAGLTQATFRDRRTGSTATYPLRHLFLFIGADPNTAWLADCGVETDAKGFLLTGRGPRAEATLETSVPGVFAIGDVRAGSTKRVAAAVGEGAAVVSQVHQHLAALA